MEQFNKLLNGYIDGYNLEKRFIRKDGSVIYTNISVGCIRNEDNSVKYFVVMIEDITDRKKAEEELEKSKEKYHTLFNSIDEGFCTVEVIFDDNDKPVDYCVFGDESGF